MVFLLINLMEIGMEYLDITDNAKIPVLGLGTWEMGGKITPNKSNDDQYINAIQTAIEMGYEHIDTAEMYGAGHTEELVGQAIKKFDRGNLFLTSKVSPQNLHYQDLIKSAEASLKRLGIDCLDLYLIHKPNSRIPISETMQAMDELVSQGLTRFIGVSNFSVPQLKQAIKAADNPIVTNQIEYNLIYQNKQGEFNRNMKDEIIPFCQEEDIIVTAFRPLAKAKLLKSNYKILDKMAQKYNKTQAQIAINWLVSQDNVITIPKATTVEHLKDNLGAVGWNLSQEDHNQLTERFGDY